MSIIKQVFCDGGLVGKNPSPLAGTWAYCYIGEDDTHVEAASGYVIPGDHGLITVTNNHSEYFAAGMALAHLPDHWEGEFFSDSKVTIGRIFWGFANGRTGVPIPEPWVLSVRKHLARLGCVVPYVLDGHPTRARLEAGIGKRGNPVSQFNVDCDRECVRLGRGWPEEYLRTVRAPARGEDPSP